MKTIAVICFFCVAVGGTVIAQDYPRGEVFGGFSYLRIDTEGITGSTLDAECNYLFGAGTCPPGTFGVHKNFYGWNAAAQVNANRRIGIKADISGHYGTPVTLSADAIAYLGSLGITGLPPKANSFSYLFGPVVSYRFSRYTVFGQALVGANRVGVNVHIKENQLQLPALTISNTALGMAFGGGIDVNVSTHFAIRGEADYLYTGHDFTSIVSPDAPISSLAAHQNNVRASVGIVYRFGGMQNVNAGSGVAHPSEHRPNKSPVRSSRAGSPVPLIGLVAVAGDGGAEIVEVTSGSIAGLAGLKPGDVINSVEGRPVKTPAELESGLSGLAPGTKIRVGFLVHGYWQAEAVIVLK